MRFASTFAVLVLTVIPGAARAAGYTTVDRSVVALGAGGTGTARADDPAANVYNPAAAATDQGFVLSTGVLLAAPTLTAEGQGWSARTRGAPTLPPTIHARYAGETLAAGASLTVPFGSTIAWKKDWPGRFELRDARLRVIRSSAFLGVHLGPVAFAAGPFFDLGALELEKSLDFVDTEGSTAIATRGHAFGAIAAVYARPIEGLALGLTYASRSNIRLRGTADFSAPVELSGPAHDQALSTAIRLPDRLTFGALYAIDPAVDLAFDLELALWGSVDRIVLDFESSSTEDVVEPRGWHATLTPRAGVTWRPAAVAGLSARAGAFVDPSPVPAETVDPASPDSMRFGVSLGAGYALHRALMLDAGYQLVVMRGVTSEVETAGSSRVAYAGRVHLFGAALTYRP